MSRYIALSAVGNDRPGLVDHIAEYILERGGNIEDSRMAILGGAFALILLVSLKADDAQRLEHDRERLEQATGLSVLMRPTESPDARKGLRALPMHVSALALDHPGILRPITRALADLGVNVATLETRTTPAPHTGSPVFSLEMDLEIPEHVPLQRVREELTTLADRLNLDLTAGSSAQP